jgi:hypothetical protein
MRKSLLDEQRKNIALFDISLAELINCCSVRDEIDIVRVFAGRESHLTGRREERRDFARLLERGRWRKVGDWEC